MNQPTAQSAWQRPPGSAYAPHAAAQTSARWPRSLRDVEQWIAQNPGWALACAVCSGVLLGIVVKRK